MGDNSFAEGYSDNNSLSNRIRKNKDCDDDNSGSFVEGYTDANIIERVPRPFNPTIENINDDDNSDSFIEGYTDANIIERVPRSFNTTIDNSGSFVEGYTDANIIERVPRPFNPTIENITEIIINPPVTTGNLFFIQYNPIINTTINDGDLIMSSTFLYAPTANSDVWMTINGVAIYPSNGDTELSTSAFYITDSTNTIIRPIGSYFIGDQFRWNGSIANYQIESDDEIKLIYQV